MNFEQNKGLAAMREAAWAEFDRLGTQLDRTRENLESRMGGNSTAAILGGLVVSILYLAAYLFLYGYGRSRVDIPLLATIALISGLALVLFLVLDALVRLNYYGGLQRHLDQLDRMRDGLRKSQESLDRDMDRFLARKEKGWDLALNGRQSVSGRASQIETAVSGMESLHRGFLTWMKNLSYYAACLAWAAFGSFALFDLARQFVDVSRGWLMAGAAAACVGEVLLARLVWSKTGCQVNNLTVLISFAGPVLFCAVIALAALVVGLVQLALYALGIIVVAAILFGSLSGG